MLVLIWKDQHDICLLTQEILCASDLDHDHLFLSQTIRTNDIDITYSPAKHFTTWKKICLKYLQEKASNNDLDHLILHNICYMEEWQNRNLK